MLEELLYCICTPCPAAEMEGCPSIVVSDIDRYRLEE